jgi:hypothetical protein
MIRRTAQTFPQGFGSQGKVIPPEMLETEIEGRFGARIRGVVPRHQAVSHQ